MPHAVYNNDVFAVLTAYDQKNKASSAFRLPLNSKWFCEAVGGVAALPTIDSREATPAEEWQADDDDELGAVDRLIITFSELMKHPLDAVQAGTNPISSHILLGHRGTRGISARQFKIVVDDELCIWLHDLHSTHGTAVGYNGQNEKEVRRRETWILAYTPGTLAPFKEVTVHAGSLAVKLEFPNHQAADPPYISNLRAFVKKCKGAIETCNKGVPRIEGLGLDNQPATQAPSEAPTPSERLIYYKDKIIGKGAFGEVRRVIKTHDGKYFAAKTFNLPANKHKRKLDEVDAAWLMEIRREFAVMRDNPHVGVPYMCLCRL